MSPTMAPSADKAARALEIVEQEPDLARPYPSRGNDGRSSRTRHIRYCAARPGPV
jgi:hypothetical protein